MTDMGLLATYPAMHPPSPSPPQPPPQPRSYLNHTGLMFENAQDFGALLVFAEHRYYGRSKPFGNATRRHMGWLTTEQAMAGAWLLYSSGVWVGC